MDNNNKKGQTQTIDKLSFLTYKDSMARPLRIEYPGAWYHVTSRGNEKKDIFKGDPDRRRFLGILSNSSNLYDVEIHAYVLMDNHFHLVVRTRDANLQRFMQRFNTTYTVYFNRRHSRSGHLYQGRYKAVLVDADSYLLELSRYVHLNPVRTRKHSRLEVKEKKDIIDRYGWSSYAGYKRKKDRQDFVEYSTILGMIGGSEEGVARRRYSHFVMSGISKKTDLSLWEDMEGQSILGSEHFVNWVREYCLSEEKGDMRELPALKVLKGGLRGTEEIARDVALSFGVEEKELYRRYASCRDARAVFMELCRRYLSRKRSLSNIGLELGGVSAAALNKNRHRLTVKMKENNSLKKQFEGLMNRWDSRAGLSIDKV